MKIIDTAIGMPERAKASVVLCHGFPGRNLNLPLANALAARGYRPLLFRYAGVDGAAGSWSFDGSARDCATMLSETRGLGAPVIALGYSLGAYHVLRALRRDTALCDALVLLGPVLSLASFRAHFASRGDTSERFISDAGGLLAGDAETRIAELHALEQVEEPLSFATRLAIPTLLVHGTQDVIVPFDDVRTAVRTFTDASALIVNDDHDYARTADTIADAVASLAARVSGASDAL